MIKRKITLLAFTVIAGMVLSLIVSTRAASAQPFAKTGTSVFVADFIKLLYEIKQVEDPNLTNEVAEALRQNSDESFITAWIQYARYLDKARMTIKPYANDPDPAVRKISNSLLVKLEPLTSDFNHLISLNLDKGVHSDEFRKVMGRLNKGLADFFEQLQVSSVDVCAMVNKLDPDAMRPKGPSRKYALSQEELQDLSREIDLFIGDDLLKFEGTNLDDVVFGDAGDDLSLPHYLWSALFMKIHIGRAIKEHSRRSQ